MLGQRDGPVTAPSGMCEGADLRAALRALKPLLTLECGAGRPNGVLKAVNQSFCIADEGDQDGEDPESCYLLGAELSKTSAMHALDALALPPSGWIDPDRHLPAFPICSRGAPEDGSSTACAAVIAFGSIVWGSRTAVDAPSKFSGSLGPKNCAALLLLAFLAGQGNVLSPAEERTLVVVARVVVDPKATATLMMARERHPHALSPIVLLSRGAERRSQVQLARARAIPLQTHVGIRCLSHAGGGCRLGHGCVDAWDSPRNTNTYAFAQLPSFVVPGRIAPAHPHRYHWRKCSGCGTYLPVNISRALNPQP
eukprot:scaffold37464_cov31-Tisochrysis_lutea.AAC.1